MRLATSSTAPSESRGTAIACPVSKLTPRNRPSTTRRICNSSLNDKFSSGSDDLSTNTSNILGRRERKKVPSVGFKIDTPDVIRLIMQFLRENNLSLSVEVLQEESSVSLDFLDSLDKLTASIRDGDWITVFDSTRNLSLPDEFLVDLYEHVCLEFLERGEYEVSETLLTSSGPLSKMKSSDPMLSARYQKLQSLIDGKRSIKSDPYQGVTREMRRIQLVDKLTSSIQCAPSGTLVSILGDAIKRSPSAMESTSNRMNFDPIRGVLRPDTSLSFINSISTLIKLPEGSKPQCLAFHPMGKFLVTGSSDGMVEIYSEKDWRISHELPFQQRGDFLVHDYGVTALGFDQTGSTLASGDKSGKVCVWKFLTGELVRTVQCCSRGVISEIIVDSYSNRLFAATDDGVVRIYGLKSGTKLKEFEFSNASVSRFLLVPNALFYSGGNDGVVRRMSCDSGNILQEVPFPGKGTHVIHGIDIVESAAHDTASIIVTYDGAPSILFDVESSVVVKEYSTPEITAGGDSFMCSIASKKSGYVYCISKRGKLFCFDLNSAQLLNVLSVVEGEVQAVVHHPNRGIMAVASSNGSIYILAN